MEQETGFEEDHQGVTDEEVAAGVHLEGVMTVILILTHLHEVDMLVEADTEVAVAEMLPHLDLRIENMQHKKQSKHLKKRTEFTLATWLSQSNGTT